MAAITLLHGFTQTAASFATFADALASHGIDSQGPELPGHGGGAVRGDLWWGADHVARQRSAGVWLGYSMGARLALHVALAHPESVTALILIGGTAGIDDEAERAARVAHDAALADHIETVGVQAFLDEWLAQPLFADLPVDPDRKRRRATNTPAGLAASLRRWGTGTMDPPLWGRLGEITAPTLVLSGARDAKFSALGRRLADCIGSRARCVTIEGAGHAAHLERPESVATCVADWLRGSRARGRTTDR